MKESKLVLGCVQFGLKYGIANTKGQVSSREVRNILQKAYEQGIHTLDTAASYGESECVLGRELAALHLTDKMKIVSKIPVMQEDLNSNEAERFIMSSIEKSLTNLKANQLDAILFHRESDLKYIQFLRKAKEQNLTRFFGASLDGAVPENAYECEVIQIPGNVLDRRFLAFSRKAKEKGIKIYNRSIYLQGLLLMEEERIPEKLKEILPYRRKLEKFAQEIHIVPSELYMRYLFSIASIDGVLTGVDTLEQLEHNCQIASAGALPQEIMEKIYDCIPELPEYLIRPSLWAANKWV